MAKDNFTTEEVRKKLEYTKALIIKPAKGALKYDYLVPAGPYTEQWDWDAFFMGVALASENPKDAIYLKNWALNCIDNATSDGKIPGCITPEGADPRLNHMKPFLGQGVVIASKFLNDFSWIQPHWDTVKKIVRYRESALWNKKYNLAVWFDSMESGADNNVAALDFPNASVLAADINAFLYSEYKALATIASKLGEKSDETLFSKMSEDIRANMLRYLWNDKDKTFYNLFIETGEHIPVITYSTFVPFWAKVAPKDAGRECISKYLLNPSCMKSSYGFRTLDKNHPRYNNANIIKPHSNWQGPVWPIANYIYMQALLNYDFVDEAKELAQTISKLVIDDIHKTGGMHENYDAETGEPLAAPNFVSWNILVRNMIEEAQSRKNPFSIE